MQGVLGECLTSMMERIGSDDAWKYAVNLILMKTRNEDPDVRLAAIRIMEKIVTQMQDKLLGLLSDIVPFAAECLEDQNELVTQSAKNVLHTFETITGESIDKYLR